ncbi:MAG: tRNA pseudouridine(55) synthase TruB, partial [Syntrophomonadaceae bacterium]|nr:tRNA pseudouridine(55) synthase TruB [Syntrophomonadaceae bacterium]
MQGFLNVNKPEGISSFEVIRKIKKLLPPKCKIGHLGTLDPLATGVLPIALGVGTRLISWITDHTKEYIATVALGATSDTLDACGSIVPTGRCDYNHDDLLKILAAYRGLIKQIPPMYSAVHHNGKRLYELARQGIETERKERTVKIYSLELTEAAKDCSGVYITLKVLCSPGTYIRTLCDDIGKDLGTGAYVSKLQRTRSGCFTIDNSSSLEELCRDAKNLSRYLLPLDCVLQDYQYIDLKMQADIDAISSGGFVLM